MIGSAHSFKLLSREKINNARLASMSEVTPDKQDQDSVESDSKKRSFLKLAGVVGVGAAATLLIPKKAEALVFGSNPTSSATGVKNASGAKINPATEDTLAGIKSQTDLLTFDAGSNPANLKVNVAAGAVGIKNSGGTQIDPATEATLAAINAKTSQMTFSSGVLQTSVGGTGNIVGLKDTTSTQVNPATDDSLVYLRRMVKLMESQAAVDGSNRQRVTIDSFGNTVTGIGASGAGVPRVTVANDSNFLATISTLNGYNDQMFQDVARNTYASGIRANLLFA